MKRNITLISFLTLLIILINCSVTVAQNKNLEQTELNVKSDLVFKINETDISNLKKEYHFSIKDIKFKSQEELDKFCTNFSFEFHSFKGDFNKNYITLMIDKTVIEEKHYSIIDINSYLNTLSRRMEYIYKNL